MDYDKDRVNKPQRSRRRRRRFFALVAIIIFLLVTVFIRRRRFAEKQDRIWENGVPLEAHIISKCPDTRDCLQELILPAMDIESSKVDFKLSFIGYPFEYNDHTVIGCMHGESECIGNIIELCAADVYADPMLYLGFVMCLSEEYHLIPQYEFVETCALQHGLDISKINECAGRDNGAYGAELLRQSVFRSNQAGVTKSCTVRLNDEIWCIRDNKKWENCTKGSTPQDLINEIDAISSLAS